MKGYKWMTSDMRAFYDGYQYHFGWNEQEGKRDGKVCVSGGFHINKYEDSRLYVACNNKCDPHEYLCNLYEVYYLKRDILGQDGEKIRVSRFKLLKKKPVIQGSRFAKHKPYIYISMDDTSSTTNYISTDNT
jgi:hypothetical protein